MLKAKVEVAGVEKLHQCVLKVLVVFDLVVGEVEGEPLEVFHAG